MANAPIRPAGALKTQYIEITPTVLSSKQATLSFTPIFPDKTIVDVIGCGGQSYGSDFRVFENKIIWSGLGMEIILSVNDRLRVQYFIL